jgi:N-acetyl-alpha-D-muramate 1-phosphate uridylyltransferase
MNLTAMILAAGKGERMRPLTETIPKPLVEVRGKPLIVHHIEKFVAMGIDNVVINVSYLAEKIQSALGDGKQFGCTISYSYEPEPLDSGGGVATASTLFRHAHFIVASADVYSNIDYSCLRPLRSIEWGDTMNSWSKDFDAHFVLIPPRADEPGREFAIDADHRLNEAEPRQTLANVTLLKTELCQSWPRGQKFKLLPYYRDYVARGRASGELFTGLWSNVTTMKDIEALNAH